MRGVSEFGSVDEESGSSEEEVFLGELHLRPHYEESEEARRPRRKSARECALWYAQVFVPHVAVWARRYRARFLLNDLVAGLVVAAMFIPQGMAYSLLAGQPAINGLYSGLLAPVVYCLLGSSMVVSVGPVALTAILTNQGVSALEPATEELFVAYSMVVALVAGLFLFLLGLLRLGFLTRYLSNTVLRGFITAAGTIIVCSQLESFFGLRVPPDSLSSFFLVQIVQQLTYLPTTNPWTLLVAGVSTGMLLFFRWKRLPRWLPGPLIVVVLGTLVSWAASLETLGVSVVGNIPSGMPVPRVPLLTGELLVRLLPTAIEVALVAYIGQVALGTLFAQRDGYTIEPTKEFLALGVANVATSFLPCQPVNASFSRSAVNWDMGAKSPLSGIVGVAVLCLVLNLLTGVLYFLPKAVLAAVVVMSVKSLIAVDEVRFLWRVDKVELVLFVGVFLATVGVGIEWGIIIAVLLSLVHLLYTTSSVAPPPLEKRAGRAYLEMGPLRAPATPSVVRRVPGPLYFGNAQYVCDELAKLPEECTSLVLDMTPCASIDCPSAHVLHRMLEALRERKVRVRMAGLRPGPYRTLERAGLAGSHELPYSCLFVDLEACLEENEVEGEE